MLSIYNLCWNHEIYVSFKAISRWPRFGTTMLLTWKTSALLSKMRLLLKAKLGSKEMNRLGKEQVFVASFSFQKFSLHVVKSQVGLALDFEGSTCVSNQSEFLGCPHGHLRAGQASAYDRLCAKKAPLMLSILISCWIGSYLEASQFQKLTRLESVHPKNLTCVPSPCHILRLSLNI